MYNIINYIFKYITLSLHNKINTQTNQQEATRKIQQMLKQKPQPNEEQKNERKEEQALKSNTSENGGNMLSELGSLHETLRIMKEYKESWAKSRQDDVTAAWRFVLERLVPHRSLIYTTLASWCVCRDTLPEHKRIRLDVDTQIILDILARYGVYPTQRDQDFFNYIQNTQQSVSIKSLHLTKPNNTTQATCVETKSVKQPGTYAYMFSSTKQLPPFPPNWPKVMMPTRTAIMNSNPYARFDEYSVFPNYTPLGVACLCLDVSLVSTVIENMKDGIVVSNTNPTKPVTPCTLSQEGFDNIVQGFRAQEAQTTELRRRQEGLQQDILDLQKSIDQYDLRKVQAELSRVYHGMCQFRSVPHLPPNVLRDVLNAVEYINY